MASDDRILLCVMTVDIGDGRSGVVNIYSDSDCEHLAEHFVHEYGLDADVLGALSEHIQGNKSLAEERLLSNSSESLDLKGDKASSKGEPINMSVEPATELSAIQNDESNDLSLPESSLIQQNNFIADCAEAKSVEPSTNPLPASIHGDPDSAAERDSEAEAEAEYEALQLQFNQRKGKSARRNTNTGPVSHTSQSAVSKEAQVKAEARESTGSKSRMSTATLARLTAPPKKIDAPTVPKSTKHADPSLFQRLHVEAAERQRKMQQMAQKAADDERAHIDEERRRLLALGGGIDAPKYDGTYHADVGHRLYSKGVAHVARKQESAASKKQEEEARLPWVCSACGFENVGTAESCSNALKFGRKLEEVTRVVHGALEHAVVRTCGAPRPQLFAPTISEFAQHLARPLDRDAHIALQLEQYLAERRRRDDEAAKKRADEEKECVFRPKLNLRSMKIVARRAAPSSSVAATEGAITAYDRLYEDAKQRKEHEEVSGRDPAPWHDCTFKPDIGTNALRPRRDKSVDTFFSRLYAEGAAARARLAAQQSRLTKQVAPAAAKPHVGPSLYEAALVSRAAKDNAEREAAAKAYADASRRHTSTGSEKLLAIMRRRALAGIYMLLVRSCSMSTDERAAEAKAQVAFRSAVGVGGASVVSGDDRLLSVDELATLIAAVDAYSGVLPAAQDFADEAHVMTIADDKVEKAVSEPLNLSTVWTGILDAPLDRYATAVVERLKSNGITVASYAEVATSFGQLLEQLGGGPQIYLLAKKKLRSASHSVEERTAGDESEPTFRPKIDPRSNLLALKSRAVDGTTGEDASVYNRLHKMGEQYVERRRQAEVQAARAELHDHPFHPRPQTAATSAVALTEAPTLSAQVEALRKKNADLAARARSVMLQAHVRSEVTEVQAAGRHVLEVDSVSRPTSPKALSPPDRSVTAGSKPSATKRSLGGPSTSRVLKPVDNLAPAPSGAPLKDKVQELDLKDLEARIERILSVDPAVEAKSARRGAPGSVRPAVASTAKVLAMDGPM